MEVIAAVRDMSESEVTLLRVGAGMTQSTDRSTLQRAIVNSWPALEKERRDFVKSKELVINVLADTHPRLSSYSPGPKPWDGIDLKCEMFIAGDGAESGVVSIIPFSDFFNRGLYMERALVIAGPRGLGKSWFAIAVAKEVAVLMKGPDAPLEDAVVFVVKTIQECRNCALAPSTPIVYDDVDLGSTMFSDANPAEFMKNATDVFSTNTSLRLLGQWHTMPRCPKIYTTNSQTLRDWCRLKSGAPLADEHYEAVARRTLFLTYGRRLHSEQQAENVVQDRAALTKTHLDAMSGLREAGAWS
jgi:hypothetical protein